MGSFGLNSAVAHGAESGQILVQAICARQAARPAFAAQPNSTPRGARYRQRASLWAVMTREQGFDAQHVSVKPAAKQKPAPAPASEVATA